jgi:DNA-binding SARP family transcriptional activator
VVEAGTANSAFAKGVRCPTVRQPLSTWAPALHRTDEPLVLCQSFLIALIGRQRALSTPIRETSCLPSLPAGLALTPFSGERYCLLTEALERRGNIAEVLRLYESLRLRLREELGTAPSSQAPTLDGRPLHRGGPVAAVNTAHVQPN